MSPVSTPISAAPQPRLFQAGTLQYNKKSLMVLSLWLLCGDFAFSFFENIFGRFIPLFLRDLNAPNWMVGMLTGSLAGLVNLFFLPNISRWSDTFRSRWGRRIPFLIIGTPLTVLSLLCIGFSTTISHLIKPVVSFVLPEPHENMITLALLCVFVVSFHFFNMVLCNGYNWLLRDVVPEEIMARFLSCFRIVNSISAIIFLYYVFPYVISHREVVFTGVSTFYLFAFLLMCWKVKEGEYPPVTEKEKSTGFFSSFLIYFRECLSIPLYRNYFITCVLYIVASSCILPFMSLFMREQLHLEMGEMGSIFALSVAASLLTYYPVGIMCDRIGPLIVMRGTLVVYTLIYVAAFFFVNSKTAYIVFSIVSSMPGMAWGIGVFTSSVALFPKEKFGQFSSGLNVFGCGALIVANCLIGAVIDLFNDNYAIAFLWAAVFGALAFVALIFVFKEWEKHGGKDHYVAPIPE